MHFFEFEKRMLKSPVFTSSEAKNIFFDEPNILVQIAFWTKKSYIKKIRKGAYILSRMVEEINPMSLAGKIYAPSYLSLEFALNYYGIIPDIPGTYTSITSRKTMGYKNQFGNFSYQKIKEELFFGYVPLEDKNIVFNIATPEKAMLDYIYLNKNKLEASDNFWQEMRIDEEFRFDRKKIESYKKIFNNKKVSKLIDSLLAYQKNAR
jgi:predicted transcriptional regulator of viral defense system